jgi:long-chain acyl-CoA synthetase
MLRPWLSFYEKAVPHTLSYSDKPLGTILSESSTIYPHHIATKFVLQYIARGRYTVGGTLTYRQLDTLVNQFANALSNIGLRKGERMAVMLPNSPHFIIAFFAAMRLGVIVVPINPTYTGREIKYQLDDSEAETIILLPMFLPRVQDIRQATPIRRIIVANIFDTLPWLSQLLVARNQRKSLKGKVTIRSEHDIFYFQNLVQTYAPHPPKVEVSGNDIALFQYTGGTTGVPKAAMLTHRNMYANTLQTTSWLADKKHGQEKVMAVIPFFHAYGLTVGMLQGLSIGSELVIAPNPRPIENVIKIIAKERCSLFPGVPAMYLGVVNNSNVWKYNIQSVRSCLSGSAPLPMDIQERFERITGGRLVEGYGLTEASPVTHCNPLNGMRKPGSIGIPLPDVDAKIVDMETGEDMPLGDSRVGEMYVRGPQVMLRYWKQTEETLATIDSDGWLHTGDICRTDDDGFFYIVDRKKDMIIVGGLKVLPREVEEVLFMHPSIRDAVVVGIPQPSRGDEMVKAYIVLQPGTTLEVKEVKDFCALYLASYKVPRDTEFRAELPRTMVGKVLRRALVAEEKNKRQRGFS